MEEKENYYKGKKNALVSVILGIIGFIFIISGIVLGPLAIWQGEKAIEQGNIKGRIGIILGIVDITLFISFIILGF